ncbi:hypothetical protein ONE63_010102 [Megalurothrips usitatus]|uniref:G-protein coupled receptors family 1 profile domain-containing protein n=1 Tax=Megalurothrips usitatus TaxID=439358 RepID=A0AAV7XLH4_9NEOP|nr:hypothetical protein ONE63_010102 [Megalurothrips usitatus]
MILAVWVVAAAITCPPILGWYEAGRHENKTCRYNQNVGYVLFSAMGSFFVPLVVMLYVYAKIHCVVARRHDHLCAWDSRQDTLYDNGDNGAPPLLQTTRKLRDVTLDVRSPVPCSYSRTMAPSGSLGALSTSCLPVTPPSNETVDMNHHHNHHHNHHPHKRQHHTYSGVSAGGPRVSSFRRAESKTAKTLWMLVGGFVACWLPFFVVYIITPFLPPDSVSKQLSSGLTWLGWINSAVNPFIYAFYSPDFRVAFWRLTLRHCTPRSKAPGGMGPPDSLRK